MNCQALNTLNISQESGMSMLANFSDNTSNQSALQNSSLQNQTNQSRDLRKDSGDLWSWGKIPIGYEVDKNGSLVKLADQQWNPSI
jgi:hypothetical protein